MLDSNGGRKLEFSSKSAGVHYDSLGGLLPKEDPRQNILNGNDFKPDFALRLAFSEVASTCKACRAMRFAFNFTVRSTVAWLMIVSHRSTGFGDF